jgi:hypothetical protein
MIELVSHVMDNSFERLEAEIKKIKISVKGCFDRTGSEL